MRREAVAFCGVSAMKCFIVVCLFVCLTSCHAGALRCHPGVADKSCTESKNENLDTREPSEATEAQCLAGSEWQSNCHYCRCSNDGVAECLKQAICDTQIFEEPVVCKPNTTFQRDCNTCVCLENGFGLCSLDLCRRSTYKGSLELQDEVESDKEPTTKSESTNILTPKHTLLRKVRGLTSEPNKACQPGQEFRMDCNKCLCDDLGQDFSCTRIDCNAPTGVRTKRDTSEKVAMKCIPGHIFDRNCNVCRCTKDGQFATCTIKRCSKPDVGDDLPESDLGFRCNAGEQFQRDCNDCTCSADGRSVFCTLRLCDVDIASDI